MNSTEKNSAALGADFLRHDTAPAGGGVEGYLEHDAAVYPGTDHEADYRALTSGGEYVWLRDVVHVVRDGRGEVEAQLYHAKDNGRDCIAAVNRVG